MTLAKRVYVLTEDRAFREPGDLCDQLRRATLSIGNNIAEGFERGTTNELLAFLYYARGSAGEARSMLLFLMTRPRFEHLKSEISDLRSLAESVSRQLRAWADSLQNSDIQGPRHLNDKVKGEREKRLRAEAFLKHLDDVVSSARAARESEAPPTDPVVAHEQQAPHPSNSPPRGS